MEQQGQGEGLETNCSELVVTARSSSWERWVRGERARVHRAGNNDTGSERGCGGRMVIKRSIDSVYTGKVGGYKTGGGGGQVKLYPCKKKGGGGAEKVLTILKGEAAQKGMR